jgi:acyl dehydratase
LALNYQKLLSRPPHTVVQDFTRRDTILYALGVGAALGDPTNADELRFVNERTLIALPTMAIVLAAPPFWFDDPAFGIDWRKLVNAGQVLELHAPLPVEGQIKTVLTIDALWDKGAAKGSILASSRRVSDGDGRLLATIQQTHLLRGDGGFGGPPPPPEEVPKLPERAPDRTVDLATRPEQALLYRLSGDYNPLHIDPEVATAAGFDRPILHGSCTFGLAGRAILRACCGNDPSKLRRLGARFSRPVYPGETLRTEIWQDGGQVTYRVRVIERGVIVLERGIAEVSHP